MAIELLIRDRPHQPSRAERLDEPVITIGRDPTSGIRFDMGADLEVSTRHAEIRQDGDAYVIMDLGSTNGTWVNGARLGGPRRLNPGDVVKLGRGGPELRVTAIDDDVWHRTVESRVRLPPLVEPSWRRNGTREYIVQMVETRTRSFSIAMLLVVAGVIGLGALGWFYVRSRGDESDMFSQVTAPVVRRANDDAVALVETEIPGQACALGCEGTGFSISAAGLIVTNRHVVEQGGTRANRIRVKFANSGAWHPAEFVVAAKDSGVDLALIRITGGGTYHAVAGVSAEGPDLDVGSAVLTIGFPLGTRLRMARAGEVEIARTTVTTGSIGKTLPDVFQIDAVADHGSSGSPVFDRHGHVVGVITSGIDDDSRKIVYVLPSSRIAELREAIGSRTP
jgi:S1-C subfamily serine protease